MTVRVGINGYGRIGRSFHRALLDRGERAGVLLEEGVADAPAHQVRLVPGLAEPARELLDR